MEILVVVLERIFYIKEGLKGFYNSPILGNGFKSFEAKYYHYSHNNYIEMLYWRYFRFDYLFINLLKFNSKNKKSEARY